MRSFWLLWSAILRMAKQTMSAWRAVVAVMMLCLMVAAGCDVRPFSELFGNDSEEDTDTDTDTGTGGETSSAESLELTPETLTTSENTPAEVEVTVVNSEPGRTYTFAIATQPTHGEADIDPNTGSLSYTPATDYNGLDSLEVTVTDDGEPERSGSKTISITVTPE